MMHARVFSAAGVSQTSIARRLELRLGARDGADAVERELADLATRSRIASRFQRRDHVRRLDVELMGDAAEVAGVVQALGNRPGVQIMRDEVLPPRGAADPLYPDASVWRRVGAPVEAGRARAPVGAGSDPPEPVVVAIVDSGVMTEHPDLTAHLWKSPDGRVRGLNLVGPDIYDVEDGDGHGTLLAGTVLAAASGSPEVVLLPVKFIDGRTRPDSERAAQAIKWAADEGAKIIDLSWEVGIVNPALRTAIEYAGTKDALVVVAAGNSGADNDRLPAFPACYGHDGCSALPEGDNRGLANVMTVMASDRFDDRAGFSNYGRSSVHIAAPGVNVTSTHQTLRSGLLPRDAGLYQRYNGSSAAAAFVAGAAALLKARNRKLTPEAIRSVLIDTADVRPDLRCKANGRVNLTRARDAV
jgi:subtilisin family serine protease